MVRMIATVLAALCVTACSRPPDAEAIRLTIARIGAAAENHRATDLMAHVSDDFSGNDGETDRAQLETIVRAQLLASRSLNVHLGSVSVEMLGDRAVARFDVTVTDTSGRWFENRETTLAFDTGWRRERGAWRCYNARWQRSP
ncbi:MAG: hypothetical protein ABIR62_10460 [Dokdonella sp.]|uniref:hypothetical protein n=1 Tax=Dokdonella sp. TaxID=2291710 RepID=UPI003264B9C5